MSTQYGQSRTPGTDLATAKVMTKAKKPTKAYHHDDLRNALIETGCRSWRRKAFEALTLREVTRRAGVSHSASYAHFADKQALLAAIAQQGFKMLARETIAAEQKHSPQPVEQLREAAWVYVKFALDHPHVMRVMFSGLAGRKGNERAALNEAAANALAALQ